MKLVNKGHRLEIYPQTMIGKMSMTSLENRSTTFTDVRRGGRSMSFPDKRFFLKRIDKGMYIFSINQAPDIKRYLENNDIKFTEDIEERDYSPISAGITLKDGVKLRDDIQRDYSAFLDQLLPSVLCTLQTGKGKTGSTIISLLKRDEKNRLAILIPPKYHVIWIEALFKFTDIKRESIVIISGRASLYQLPDLPDDIEAVILSPATVREYVKSYLSNDDIPFTPDKIMEYIGSEDLIIDETHEDFAGNYLNVLALNPKRYIALTASYSSESDSDEITRFKKYFIPEKNRLPVAEFDKYVNIVFCQYRVDDPNKVQHKNDITGWYNHHIYEQSMLDVDSYKESYFNMILWFLKQYYDNKHRMLFLFSRVSMCIEFKEWLIEKDVFKDKKICTYIAGDPKDNLKNDIIIATNKSGGTGVDVENLQTTVNTINTGSDYSAIQYSGRNREMKGVEQYFLSLMAINIPSHMNYMRANKEIYDTRAKNMIMNYYTVGNICKVNE
jgi:hypothetical protein